MKCLVYANCQGEVLANTLSRYIPFSEKYSVQYLYNVQLCSYREPIPYHFFEEADLVVYQPIDAKWGEYSTDLNSPNNVLKKVKRSCNTISFPYIYNDGTFILYYQGKEIINRIVIEELLTNYDHEGILYRLKKLDIDFKLGERFQKSIEILNSKERFCDIKVSDYILSNIRSKKLFISQNHPTEFVLEHVLNQFLGILGFPPTPHGYVDLGKLHNAGWPTSPYEIEFFKYEYKSSPDDNWYNFYSSVVRDIIYKKYESNAPHNYASLDYEEIVKQKDRT